MVAMDEYIGALEHVRGTLGEASEKYGRKDSRKRVKIKHVLGHLDRSGGAQVLEACQTEIEAAVKRFGVKSSRSSRQVTESANSQRS
ncbi:hypothetical protein FRC01_009133 [Tulasnella sp. 417]|nr:hypothetical protein FRC01_009133 [Tulasnella sp. 417]